MFAKFFLGSLYLERVLGYNPLRIGLAFLPVTVVMGLLSVRYSDRIVPRFGARRTLITGLVRGNYVLHVLPVTIFLGTGGGPSLMSLAMRGTTSSDAGLAGGLINTTASVGGSWGLAILATLSAVRAGALEKAGRPVAQALTEGYHPAFRIGAALIAITVAIAATVQLTGVHRADLLPARHRACQALGHGHRCKYAGLAGCGEDRSS